MYHLREKVFIAWGGNYELAKKLSENLNQQKIENFVGGDALNSEEAIETVSGRVFHQMQQASRAIILAEGKEKSDGTFEFRPNLMFEWGYLLGRLPRGAVTVVFIDTPREGAPSDLQGGFSLLVPDELTKTPRRARWISEQFVQQRLIDRYHPFDTLHSWSKAKVFLENQVNGDAAPNPELFERVILTSFLPALLTDEVYVLEDFLRTISANPLSSRSHHIRLTADIIKYFGLTLPKPAANCKSDMQALKRSMSSCVDAPDVYVRMIARHFMGRCLKKMAISERDTGRSRELMGHALYAFLKSEELLLKCKLDEQSENMWLAIIYRKVSRAAWAVGNSSKAFQYAEKCISARQDVVAHLHTSFNSQVKDAVLAEYYLSVCDYVGISRNIGFTPFKEMADLNLRRRCVGNYWWARVNQNYTRLTKPN